MTRSPGKAISALLLAATAAVSGCAQDNPDWSAKARDAVVRSESARTEARIVYDYRDDASSKTITATAIYDGTERLSSIYLQSGERVGVDPPDAVLEQETLYIRSTLLPKSIGGRGLWTSYQLDSVNDRRQLARLAKDAPSPWLLLGYLSRLTPWGLYSGYQAELNRFRHLGRYTIAGVATEHFELIEKSASLPGPEPAGLNAGHSRTDLWIDDAGVRRLALELQVMSMRVKTVETFSPTSHVPVIPSSIASCELSCK